MIIAEKHNVLRLSAKDYIQDGLIAMWDGIENVGYNRHDSNTTIWKDLVGSYDQTINSGTWTSNSLMNCSVGKYQEDPNAYAMWDEYNKGNSNTFQVVLRVSDDSERNYIVDSIFGFILQIWSDNRGSIFNSRRCFGFPNGTPTLGKGVSQTLSFTQNSEGNKYYRNSDFYISSNTAWAAQGYPRRDSFAFHNTDKIYCIRFYNRELSEEEILSNYLIDKERFCL